MIVQTSKIATAARKALLSRTNRVASAVQAIAPSCREITSSTGMTSGITTDHQQQHYHQQQAPSCPSRAGVTMMTVANANTKSSHHQQSIRSVSVAAVQTSYPCADAVAIDNYLKHLLDDVNSVPKSNGKQQQQQKQQRQHSSSSPSSSSSSSQRQQSRSMHHDAVSADNHARMVANMLMLRKELLLLHQLLDALSWTTSGAITTERTF